jgi:hypothetical protein
VVALNIVFDVSGSMQPALQVLPLWAQVALAIVPAFGAFFAAFGLWLNVQQSRKTNAQARAALVAGCLKGFAEDKEIQKAFCSIDYSEFRYDENFYKSAQEQEIDKLLRHFSNLALAWQAGLLSTVDVRPVQYYVLRVMRNSEIKKYLAFIARLSRETGLGEHPYAVLTKMSEKLAT